MRIRWIAPAGVLLALAGCAPETGPGIATAGGGPTASATPDAREQGRLLAACLRAEGLDVADPPENAGPKADVVPGNTVDKQKLLAAMEKCRRYAPDGGPGKAIAAEDIEALRRHAECMRRQGFPEWPDPDPATGKSDWADPAKALAAKNDPRFRPALAACRDLDPAASPRP